MLAHGKGIDGTCVLGCHVFVCLVGGGVVSRFLVAHFLSDLQAPSVR